jgi:hypothetical protein
VQVDYNVVHLRTSKVQLFVLFLQNFEKVVQMIKLKRFGGAPNGYPFAPLGTEPGFSLVGSSGVAREFFFLKKSLIGSCGVARELVAADAVLLGARGSPSSFVPPPLRLAACAVWASRRPAPAWARSCTWETGGTKGGRISRDRATGEAESRRRQKIGRVRERIRVGQWETTRGRGRQ